MKWSTSIVILVVLLISSEAKRDKRGKLSNSRFYRQTAAASPRDHRAFADKPVAINQVPHQQVASVQQPQQVVPAQQATPTFRQASPFNQPLPINFPAQQQQQPQQISPFRQQPSATFQSNQQTKPIITPAVRQAAPSSFPFAQPQQAQNANLQNAIVNQVLRNTPYNSQLVGVSDNAIPATGGYIPTAPGPVGGAGPAYSQVVPAPAPQYPPGSLLSKLIANATYIRPNIQEGFTCENKGYGYYADQINDCQIFHICFPLKDVFKYDPAVSEVPDITYTFSFICNSFTRFSQDSLTCGWIHEVVPCESAHLLYDRNEELLKTTTAAPNAGPGPVVPGYPLGSG